MKETVVEMQNGRLDKVCSEIFSDYSRSQIKQLLDGGNITVNGKTEKAKYKVKSGDVIRLEEPETKTLELRPENIPLDIVYEDDDVIVINKPQGMVVHPAAGTR